jgi:F-type H+-transporting ATPase subunit gamma
MNWVLADLAETLPLMDEETMHPLLRRREVKNAGAVYITPSRGLCGGLPANMNRRVSALTLEQGAPMQFVAVGRTGREFLKRTNVPVVAEFTELGDYPEYQDVLPITRVVIDDYLAGRVDQVFLVYPYFVNTVTQQPESRQLLPIEPPTEAETHGVDYIYEPDRATVLADILPRYIEMQIFEAILEGIASEQSARMVAMRNATDAANEMIEELTLTYNKARQEQITKELLDIVGGVEGLKV